MFAGVNRQPKSVDTYLALPRNSLGIGYVGASYTANIRSQIGIVGTLDDTRIRVTLPNRNNEPDFAVTVEHNGNINYMPYTRKCFALFNFQGELAILAAWVPLDHYIYNNKMQWIKLHIRSGSIQCYIYGTLAKLGHLFANCYRRSCPTVIGEGAILAIWTIWTIFDLLFVDLVASRLFLISSDILLQESTTLTLKELIISLTLYWTHTVRTCWQPRVT